MIFPYIIRVLRVARNGGQALVTSLDRFLCRVRLYRGVTMLRPRLHAIPERVVEFFQFFCKKFVISKRVTAGTGPRYVEATKGRSNVTWFRPPVTRARLCLNSRNDAKADSGQAADLSDR